MRFSPVRCPLRTTYHEETSFDLSKKTFQLKLRLLRFTEKKNQKNKNTKNGSVTLARIAYFVIHPPFRGRSRGVSDALLLSESNVSSRCASCGALSSFSLLSSCNPLRGRWTLLLHTQLNEMVSSTFKKERYTVKLHVF